MAESLDLVEIAPEPPVASRDYEDLPARRKRPGWLTRWGAKACVGLVVVALGTVLAADHSGTARSSLAHTVGGECPTGVPCQEYGFTTQDRSASLTALFIGATATGAQIWFDPTTGIVYSQVLTARQSDVVIRLSQVRSAVAGSAASELPTEFDVPLQWHPRLMPRTVIISCQRGVWLLTAIVSGPWDGHLPLDAARQWVVTAPPPQ